MLKERNLLNVKDIFKLKVLMMSLNVSQKVSLDGITMVSILKNAVFVIANIIVLSCVRGTER